MLKIWQFALLFALTGWSREAWGDEPPDGGAKSIEVQVTDWSGQPIGQATIRMQQCSRFDFGNQEIPQGIYPTVTINDGADRTDARGIWRSPPLPAQAAYYVAASAPGFVSEFGRWVHRDEGGLVKLPTLQLRRLATLTGRIQDTDGRPVDGALVFHSGDGPKRVESRSKEDGSFVLAGVPEGPLLVFVDAPDCYFTGRLIESSQDPILFTVGARLRPNPDRLVRRPRPTPAPLPTEEIRRRRAAAITELQSRLDSLPENERGRTFAEAARIDPEASVRLFRQSSFSNDAARESALYAVIIGLKEQKCTELELLLPDLSGRQRSSVIEFIIRSQTDSTRRYEWLGRMLREARRELEPTNLAFYLVRVAELYRKYGYAQEAIRLLRLSEQTLNDTKPSELTANVYFDICATWCAMDQDEAIRLLPKCPANAYERLAEKLAAKHPELAEKLFVQYALATGTAPSGHWHTGLCYELAKSDLARAERMADSVLQLTDLYRALDTTPMVDGPGNAAPNPRPTPPSSGPGIKRAILQGFLANARFEAGDREGAKRLLADSQSRLRGIDDVARHTRSGFVWKPSEALAILQLVAERVDPDTAVEYYWAALAKREPTPAVDSHDVEAADHSAFEFARILCRFDERIAAHFVRPLLERAVSRSQMGSYASSVPGWLYGLDAAEQNQWLQRFSNRPSPLPQIGHSSPKAFLEQRLLSLQLANRPVVGDDDRDWVYLLDTYWMGEMYEKLTHRSPWED